jgi:hypothetical protein
MNKGVPAFGSRQIASLVLVLVLVLGWATVASAQTIKDAQYSDPTASGKAAIENSHNTGGGSVGDPSDPSDEFVGGVLGGVLPATGGPLLAFVGLCAVALGSTGVLVLRLNGRRR